MNSDGKPLNQYSLQKLELWLDDIGAKKDIDNPSEWHLVRADWEATICFEQEDLRVCWDCDGKSIKRLFSYCINKEDVQNAILQGP